MMHEEPQRPLKKHRNNREVADWGCKYFQKKVCWWEKSKKKRGRRRDQRWGTLKPKTPTVWGNVYGDEEPLA